MSQGCVKNSTLILVCVLRYNTIRISLRTPYVPLSIKTILLLHTTQLNFAVLDQEGQIVKISNLATKQEVKNVFLKQSVTPD